MHDDIKRIRFTVLAPERTENGQLTDNLRMTDVEFKLGMGPCGLEVLKLELNRGITATINTGCLTVTQYTASERKTFTYKHADIVGKQEVTHEYDAYAAAKEHLKRQALHDAYQKARRGY